MANYEKFEETKTQLTAELASNNNISEEQKAAVVEAVTNMSTTVQSAINDSIQSSNSASGTTENTTPTINIVENVTVENLQNVNVAVVTGGTSEQIDIQINNDAPVSDQLAAIVVASDKPVELTIENENFGGSVVLGAGTANVVIETPKSVTIETGTGDANIQTGLGNDKVIVKANATLDVGGGDNTVVFGDDYTAKATVKAAVGGVNVLQVPKATVISSAKENTVANARSQQITNSESDLITVNTFSNAEITTESLVVKTAQGGEVGATNFNNLVLDDTPILIKLADSNMPLDVTTGRGADNISLGGMNDTVTLTGGDDTVSTGAGDDTVKINADFSGNARVRGGAGKNELIVDKAQVVMEDNGSLSVELSDGSSVSANQFKTVTLGDSGSSINTQIATLKVISKASLNVVTGQGNDSVALGIGYDSVTISGGNDSVNTGAGRDTVKIASTFTGNATVDGNAGRDTLDLTDINASSLTLNGNKLVVAIDNATVNASNFEAIVFSDDDTNIDLATAKSGFHVKTGEGDDSVVLGAGRDTVVLTSGNDSVNTGMGNDRVKIDAAFNGDADLDGDAGTFDILDLSAVGVASVDKTDAVVTITLENGSTLNVTNVEYFVYSTSDAPDEILFTGVTTLIDSF